MALPPADLDRRFYAFVVDRLLAWGLVGIVGYFAWRGLIDDDATVAGVAVIAGALLVVSLAFAVALGISGMSPGKALLGLRVVRQRDGRPVGVGHAIIRTALLGVLTLPTAGIGLAALAMTAVLDPDGRRRGGHDRMSGAVVVDVRPQAEESADEQMPRQIVNLTALRLAPARLEEPGPVAASPVSAPRATPAASVAPPRPTPVAPLPPSAQPERAPTAPAAPAGPPGTPGPTANVPARAAAPITAPPETSAPSPSGATQARSELPIADAGGARWHVQFDTGESFDVLGLALVGRAPEPRAGEEVAHVVPLRSSDMSVSKTHAQFQMVPDGALVVMDRGSTNGSVLVRQGIAKALTPGRATTLIDGDTVRFGDRSMKVRKL